MYKSVCINADRPRPLGNVRGTDGAMCPDSIELALPSDTAVPDVRPCSRCVARASRAASSDARLNKPSLYSSDTSERYVSSVRIK